MSQLVERFSQPGYWEELISFNVGLKLRGFKRMADRSRMNREVHVRFWGVLEVKLLRSTRLCNQLTLFYLMVISALHAAHMMLANLKKLIFLVNPKADWQHL